MNINQALFQLFAADADLTALVGNRIYPLSLPDKMITWPAIVRVALGRNTTKIYDFPGRSALVESHFRFITQSFGRDKYDQAHDASEALRLCLEGYKGDLIGGSPVTTLHIDGAFLYDYREVFEDETSMNLIVSEFLIHHTQTIRNS